MRGDIPGLLEGASRGVGLGHRFLKHISRTSALAFLVDLSDEQYLEAFPMLLGELGEFRKDLEEKRRIIVATKLDVDGAEEKLQDMRETYADEKVIGISSFAMTGIGDLRSQLLSIMRQSSQKDQK